MSSGDFFLSEEDAAILIQGLYRSRKSRLYMKLLMQIVERVYDENSGAYYYYNEKTGESSWEAPKGTRRRRGS